MMSLTFSRGARLTCALTTILIGASVWGSAPALAASGGISSFEKTPVSINSGSPAHAASGSLSGTIVRTIVALLIVIAVIYGLTWLLKQSRSGRNPSVGEGLAQVASLPLGPNRSVTLVRVGAELHLLGVAEHGINGIRVFSEEEAYELGIPFDSDDFDQPGRPGGQPKQRVVDALRRLTVR
jgi:flagellar protein FliO/FliZ